MNEYKPKYDTEKGREFLASILPDTVSEKIEKLLSPQMDAVIDCALSYLSFREKMIVKLRTGIGGCKYSLTECSKQFSVTIDRIRYLEQKSFKKLSESVKQKVLTDLL